MGAISRWWLNLWTLSHKPPYKPPPPPRWWLDGMNRKRAAYKVRTDGEGFVVESGEVHRIACCDCGLVHDFVFVSDDGAQIGIAAKRNPRATAAKRRNKKALKQADER